MLIAIKMWSPIATAAIASVLWLARRPASSKLRSVSPRDVASSRMRPAPSRFATSSVATSDVSFERDALSNCCEVLVSV